LIVRSKEGAGYLIDFKSVKRIERPQVLAMLRQILTYALMDEGDRYEIRHVGFYFTRYGVWAHWDLQALLDTALVSGASGKASAVTRPAKTLDSHRQALRRMLLDLHQPEALNVALPRR
jgi:hypothetical protein